MVVGTVCVYGYVCPRNDCSQIGMEKLDGRMCKTTVCGTGLGCPGFSVGVGLGIPFMELYNESDRTITTKETRIFLFLCKSL